MIAAPVYIFVRFFQRLVGFLSHWYVGASRTFWFGTRRALLFAGLFFRRPEEKGTPPALFWAVRSVFAGALSVTAILLSAALYVAWILVIPYAFLKVLEGIVL